MTRISIRAAAWSVAACLLTCVPSAAGAASELPPAVGPSEPQVAPVKGDDGIYHQSWFKESFLDLREDLEEAKAKGKRFVVIFEQVGCVYCTKMHKEVLSQKYINDYVRENFVVVQMDLWGAREVTDFDGKTLTEKAIAKRWGVIYTPTILFFTDDLTGKDGKSGRELEVSRIPGFFQTGTFYDMFTWVRIKGYEKEEHFQKFHIRRLREREALQKAGATTRTN
ncbi:MAG: thioredoxin family protein [Methyloligellaceae bacterium]